MLNNLRSPASVPAKFTLPAEGSKREQLALEADSYGLLELAAQCGPTAGTFAQTDNMVVTGAAPGISDAGVSFSTTFIQELHDRQAEGLVAQGGIS